MATADHSHTLTINGYAKWEKGTDGVVPQVVNASDSSDVDGMPYMVFSYANGPGFYRHLKAENGSIARVNPTSLDLVLALC